MAKRKALAKVLSSKIVFKGRVFGVRREKVIEPGRVEATREIVTPGIQAIASSHMVTRSSNGARAFENGCL